MPTFARHAGHLHESATMSLIARSRRMRAQGHDVVPFGAGKPDFDTPEHIKEAAIEAIRDGFTKYTEADGTPSLKRCGHRQVQA